MSAVEAVEACLARAWMMRRYAAVTDQTLRAAAEAVAGSERIVERLA